LLRTVDPPLPAAQGRKVVALRRIGKRIVWEMEGKIFLVFHLMIAGRFKWRPEGTKSPAKVGLASFDFPTDVALTEASTKKRASLYVVAARRDSRRTIRAVRRLRL
jgi:formamidopyrimidine-DNA glycosylase